MSPTTSTTTTSPATRRRKVSTSACALLAAAASLAAVSFWLGVAPNAQADPGDTFVPIGSGELVQSEDLDAIQVKLNTEKVAVHRDSQFSYCAGRSWMTVLPGSSTPINATWTRRGKDQRSLTESIAQATSPAQAKRDAATLVKAGINPCTDPKYDFHYGPRQSSRVGTGYATWALTYIGNRTHADGGVVVIRKGSNVGYLEVNGIWGSADQTLESVAKVAVDRLG